MAKTVMMIHSLRWLTVVAPVPLLWLMGVASPLTLALMILLVAAAIVTAALRIGWGMSRRSMSDVIHDVDVEAPSIGVRPTSAVSISRAGGRA